MFHTLTLTLIASHFVTPASHTRAQARRLRHIERKPDLATVADVELLLRAHGVAETRVWRVVDAVAAAHLVPTTVWGWAMTYDGNALGELFSADLDLQEVIGHLECGTLPASLSGTGLALAA